MNNRTLVDVPARPLNPWLAAGASFLLPGLGQFLVGQRSKGLLFFLLTLLGCGLGYLLAPALAWDAWYQAKRQAAGEELDPWGFF